MSHNRTVQIIALACTLLALAGAGLVGAGVSDSAGRHRLIVADQAQQSDPPQVALGIALGAFRGIFVNFLWIRANELKEAGQYHEAIELSKAITTLQPRFPRVWVFHAWNMAYNISVSTQTPEERWEWVNAGIRLLRDQGIPANPNDMLLHRELAWFFLHKIGGITDDSNQYYKRALAQEWTIVLGDPPPPSAEIRDTEAATRAYADWLRTIATAPESLNDVIAAEPSVRALITALRSNEIDPVSKRLLTLHARYSAALKSSRAEEFRAAEGGRGSVFMALLEDPVHTQAWAALLPHVRKRVLIDEYNMEPWRMVAFTERYGPLDWRHPASHSLYWGARGVELALSRWTERNRQDFDFINADRIVFQSLQELYRSGDVYYNLLDDLQGRDGFYLALLNTHFIESYGNLLDERERFLNPDSDYWTDLTPEEKVERQHLLALWWPEHGRRPYRTFAAGYENFMRDAIRTLYRRGEFRRANQMLDRLLTWSGQNTNDPDRAIELGVTLDDFVRNELQDERILSGYVAVQEVAGSLYGAFMNGLLARDGELFERQYQFAALAHRYYMEKQLRQVVAGGEVGRTEVMPRDFREMAGSLFAQLASILPVEQAEVLFGEAPNELRVWAYDILVERFKPRVDQAAQRFGTPAFEVLFPQPAGIERHRAMLEQRRLQREQERPEVITK